MGRKTKYNSVVTPELLAQVNPENLELLNDFLDYLRSSQKSEITIKGYKSDIEIFFIWNLKFNGNRSYIDLTKRQLVKYQNWLLNENQNGPARIRRLKATLSSFSNFICNILDEDYPNFRNIIGKVENPVNQPVREKTVLTDEQVDTLLSTLMERKEYDRACVVALAVYSGRRKAELLRFKVSSFDDDHLIAGGALWKTDFIVTKGRGGGKMLQCYCLAKQFRPYLDAWMNYRKENEIESEWLFPSKRNPDEPLKISTLNYWCNEFSDILGVPIYMHNFRHYNVSAYKRAGLTDSIVQKIQGWESLEMVKIYSDLDIDDELEMYFDENGIKQVNQKDMSEI